MAQEPKVRGGLITAYKYVSEQFLGVNLASAWDIFSTKSRILDLKTLLHYALYL